MKLPVLYILTLCAIFFSCQDEFTNKAVFTTHEVIRTTEGASFKATIAILDDGQYNDYGFVWADHSIPSIADSVHFFGGVPTEGGFDINVGNDLVPGTVYYVRAFLKEKSNVIYSNQVIFESLGSATPSISSFTPDHGSGLDTITIRGSNFSRVMSNVRVKIGEVECELLESSRELLKIRLPQRYVVGSFPIEVNVSGKATQSKESFVFDGPSIQNISPATGASGTIVTITGSNFSAEAAGNHVFVGGNIAEVLNASSTALVIQIPQHVIAGMKDVAIEIEEATFTLPNAFNLTGPAITSLFPTSGVQGSIVTIEGTGFSEKPGENIVTLSWATKAEILSASPNKLVVQVPSTSVAGTFPLVVTVRGTEASIDDFTILAPEITAMEPRAQYAGRTVKIIGKNFKAAPYVTSVYFNGAGANASIESITDTEIVVTVPYDLNRNAPITLYVGGLFYTTPFEFDVLSPWVTQPDFPGDSRYGAVGFSIGSYGYVGMGITANGDARDMWRFNSNNRTWKRMSDFPGSARAHALSFVIDGKAYVGFGGSYSGTYENFTDLWEYDPANDSWTQKSNPPHYFLFPYHMMVEAVSSGRSGYFCVDNWLYQYDADTDMWSRTSAPVSNYDVALAASGKMYFGLGVYYPYLYEFDPIARTWQNVESGIGSTGAMIGFTIDDKLYMGTSNNFVEYDPATRVYRSLPSFSSLHYHAATFTIGNTAYAVSGVDAQGSQSVVTFNPNY